MTTKRKSLSKKTRFEVFKRDEFTCQYCGDTPPKVILEVDHVLSVKEGGTNDIINLVTSCFECNRGKGARNLNSLPKNTSRELKARKIKHEQLVEFNEFLLEKREYDDNAIDEIGVFWENNFQTAENQDKYTFGSARVASIRRFLKVLTTDDIKDYMEIAFMREYSNNSSWKYFCGICWNKIRER